MVCFCDNTCAHFGFGLRTKYREIKVELSAVYLYFIGFWACVNLHVFNFTFSLTNPISCYSAFVCVLMMMLVLLSQRYLCTVCFRCWTMNDSHFAAILRIAFRNDKIIFVAMRDLIRCNTANIQYIIGFLFWLFLILIEHVFSSSPSFFYVRTFFRSVQQVFLLAHCKDNGLYLRTLATGTELHSLKGHKSKVNDDTIDIEHFFTRFW